MSQRGRPDLNPTHLVAGGMATATATVATSYLGVAGTIVGAALMSVATTAGAAVYQYYLDRGKRRYVTLVTSEVRHRFVPRRPTEAGKPAEPAEEEHAGSTEPEKPEKPETQKTPENRDEPNPPDETAELKEAPVPAPDDAAGTPAEPRRPRWYVLTGAAFAIFAVVIGAITAVEALAHKPVSAMLGRSDRSGTSLGGTFGGGTAPTRHPVVPSSTVPASPPSTTSIGPSVVPSQPATGPVAPPSPNPSAPATTTRPPAPTPTTPSTQPTAP